MGARWFLIGFFDRRRQIARLSEFFWTRDWNPPLFGLDPLLVCKQCLLLHLHHLDLHWIRTDVVTSHAVVIVAAVVAVTRK